MSAFDLLPTLGRPDVSSKVSNYIFHPLGTAIVDRFTRLVTSIKVGQAASSKYLICPIMIVESFKIQCIYVFTTVNVRIDMYQPLR